jgi:polar amino acid transport system substrate-binding protein
MRYILASFEAWQTAYVLTKRTFLGRSKIHRSRCRAAFQNLLIAGLGIAAFALQVQAEERLSVTLTSADYPPLVGLNLPFGGVLTRIVVESFRAANVDVHFVHVANNRAITGVMMDLYDGSYGWAHNTERDKKLLFSHYPLTANRMVFFQLRGRQFPWTTLADLHPYLIGATLGNHYSDEFSALQAARVLRVENSESDLSNMRKLLYGRIDLFPMEEEAGQLLVLGNFTPQERSQIIFQDNAFSTVPVYLVIRRSLPNAAELVQRFDRGFRKLSDAGELPKLFDETLKAVRQTYRQTDDKRWK